MNSLAVFRLSAIGAIGCNFFVATTAIPPCCGDHGGAVPTHVRLDKRQCFGVPRERPGCVLPLNNHEVLTTGSEAEKNLTQIAARFALALRAPVRSRALRG